MIKILKLGAIVFAVWYVMTSPDAAAGLVADAGSLLQSGAESVAAFIQTL